EQRAARIPRIQRRVRLNDVVDQTTRYRTERATERADDAGGDCTLEAERIPDRDDDLTDAERRRVAQWCGDQRRGVDAQNREIGLWIIADQLRAQPASIGECHLGFGCAVGHMAVRENEAVRCERESRSVSLCFATRTAAPAPVLYFHAHHRRRRALHHAAYGA